MITSFLNKIAGFLEKDFLFASFLPALLFGASIFVTLASIVGISSTVAVYESWSGWQHAAAAATLGVILVVMAYVLSALRPAVAQFWSGTAIVSKIPLWGFLQLGEMRQRRSFRRLKARAEAIQDWGGLLDAFEAGVRQRWSKGHKQPSLAETMKLRELAEGGLGALSIDEIHRRIGVLVKAYDKYASEDLGPAYQTMKTALLECANPASLKAQTAQTELDRRFGALETVRPTRLGNLIEAYNEYPFKRYKIEPTIFWPRLVKVVPPDYRSVVEEPRILFDFALTMASLSVAYAMFALFIGPWLWYNVVVWLLLGLTAVCSAGFFYVVGIGAADQFGDLVRSSFDLFRLDLMKAMGRPDPPTFFAEQQQWEELSHLVAYGAPTDFALRQPAKSPAAGP